MEKYELDDSDELPCDGVAVYVTSVEIDAGDTPQEAAVALGGAFGADWCGELWRILAGTV